jgi:hypothetical protein
MIAAHAHRTEITLEFLQESIDSLIKQIRQGGDFLRDRRPISLVTPAPKKQPRSNPSPFG